jgi:hypothetical protein
MHWTMLEDNVQIGEKSLKYGEKKIDKQVIGHLLLGLVNIGSLMETKSLEESKCIIPKLCAFAILSILQISTNVGRSRGLHSQHLVMQKRKSPGQSLGKGGQNSSCSSILA